MHVSPRGQSVFPEQEPCTQRNPSGHEGSCEDRRESTEAPATEPKDSEVDPFEARGTAVLIAREAANRPWQAISSTTRLTKNVILPNNIVSMTLPVIRHSDLELS